MRKMLITLALVAGPVIAAAQTPTQTPDTSKAKPKTPPAHHAATKPKPKTAADTSKAKPATQAPAADTTKKPN